MKSFDEWFSEQGSSQEEPQAEKELERQSLAEPQMEVKTIKRPGRPDLYVPVYKAAEPIKDSFKEAFPDYDEVWHNNIRFVKSRHSKP